MFDAVRAYTYLPTIVLYGTGVSINFFFHKFIINSIRVLIRIGLRISLIYMLDI